MARMCTVAATRFNPGPGSAGFGDIGEERVGKLSNNT